MNKPKEFWVSQDLVVRGQKVEAYNTLHRVDCKQCGLDEYNYGTITVHVIEKSAYDIIAMELMNVRSDYLKNDPLLDYKAHTEAKINAAIDAFEEILTWENSHEEETVLKRICKETLDKLR